MSRSACAIGIAAPSVLVIVNALVVASYAIWTVVPPTVAVCVEVVARSKLLPPITTRSAAPSGVLLATIFSVVISPSVMSLTPAAKAATFNGASPSVKVTAVLRAVSATVAAELRSMIGWSLTEVTSNVMVLGVTLVSTPPLAVPPMSWTWNVKLASALPFELAAGV